MTCLCRATALHVCALISSCIVYIILHITTEQSRTYFDMAEGLVDASTTIKGDMVGSIEYEMFVGVKTSYNFGNGTCSAHTYMYTVCIMYDTITNVL